MSFLYVENHLKSFSEFALTANRGFLCELKIIIRRFLDKRCHRGLGRGAQPPLLK